MNKYAVILFERAGNAFHDIPPHIYMCTNIRFFDNGLDALNYYANTPCPESQLVSGENENDLQSKIDEMIINYQNEKWLNENLYPYL